MTNSRYTTIGEIFTSAALEAGAVVMRHYGGAVQANAKPDASPVTAADIEAEHLILHRLAQALPDIPVISEEAAAGDDEWLLEPGRRFILVDPLDGTREFLERNGEFTVNIALVEDGVATVGVVHAPADGRLWLGWPGHAERRRFVDGAAEEKVAIMSRAAPRGAPLVAAVSRANCDARTNLFLSELPIASRIEQGSALKFCLLAEGAADIYPRFTPTMEWDTAAGHAVLRGAGGEVRDLEGAPLRYGKLAQGFRNGAFVARGAA